MNIGAAPAAAASALLPIAAPENLLQV